MLARKTAGQPYIYIKLKQVVNPARAAPQPDLDCGIGITYMRLNNLEGLSPVF